MRASQRKWSGKKERHLHRKSEATATAAAMPHFCFAATPSKNYPLSRLLFEVCAMPPGGAEFRENMDDVMSTGDGDGRMRARGEGGRARARDGWSQRGRRPTLEPIHSCGCTRLTMPCCCCCSFPRLLPSCAVSIVPPLPSRTPCRAASKTNSGQVWYLVSSLFSLAAQPPFLSAPKMPACYHKRKRVVIATLNMLGRSVGGIAHDEEHFLLPPRMQWLSLRYPEKYNCIDSTPPISSLPTSLPFSP